MIYYSENRLANVVLLAGLFVSFSARSLPLQVDYTYDPINRLTAATYSTGQQLNYAYDPAGNLTRVSHSGGGTPVAPPVTVAPGASAVLSSPSSVTLGAGSTLTVQAQALGSTLVAPTSGSATVHLGSAATTVNLTALDAGGKVQVVSGGSTGSLVLAYLSGTVLVGSTMAAQPLLDLGSFAASGGAVRQASSRTTAGGRSVLAGSDGGRIQARQDARGHLLIEVLDGTVSMPCNLQCRGSIILLAGELATIGSDGWPIKLEAMVQPLVANQPGLELPATAPMLHGAMPQRAQGSTLNTLVTRALERSFNIPLDELPADRSGTLGWGAGGLHLNVLPLTQPQIQGIFSSDGEISFLADGGLRLLTGTLMMDVGPMPANAQDMVQVMRGQDPEFLLRVQSDGVWRLRLKGKDLAIRPDWITAPGGHEGQGFEMVAASIPTAWISRGMRTALHPALANAPGLRSILQSLDPSASLAVQLDSSAQATVGGVRYGLQPLPELVPLPPARQNEPMWLENQGSDLLLWMPLEGGLAQGMRVWVQP